MSVKEKKRKNFNLFVPVMPSRELGSDHDGKRVEERVDARCELTGMKLSTLDGYLNPLLLHDVFLPWVLSLRLQRALPSDRPKFSPQPETADCRHEAKTIHICASSVHSVLP